MEHIWQAFACAFIFILLLVASGCDGFFSNKGPGLKVQWDGKAHYLKIGER